VVDHPPTTGEFPQSLSCPHPFTLQFLLFSLLLITFYFRVLFFFFYCASLSVSDQYGATEVSEYQSKASIRRYSYFAKVLESRGKVTSFSTLLNSKHVYQKHPRNRDGSFYLPKRKKSQKNQKRRVVATHSQCGERQKLPIEPRLALFPNAEV
jgi:hypothetical protein